MKTEPPRQRHLAAALVDQVAPAVCLDLQRIGATVQDGLLEGVARVVSDIRDSEQPSVHDARALDVIAASARELSAEVAALFASHQRRILQLRHAAYGSGEA
jgi:hypothetical protein